ncbi:MAG: hypothetical protein HDR08_02285 [Lachnospiraceae bacterium]|nr:hypothetical protein [Lachnospiraceae bacterium]
MNIIFDVLEELKYVAKEEFEVVYKSEEEKKVVVTPFISKENVSQVFLILSCKNAFLGDVNNSDLVKKVALQFRRKEYHKAEMDRNSTLLILSEHEVDEAVNMSEKIKIEDNPYYFKKYVFSFDEISKQKTEEWIRQNGKNDSSIATIQDYIANTNNFARYKDNNQNEAIYAFLIELIIKIPSFPMKTAESQYIHSVEQYLNDGIQELKTGKKPIIVKRSALDKLVDIDIASYKAEKICELWKEILGE